MTRYTTLAGDAVSREQAAALDAALAAAEVEAAASNGWLEIDAAGVAVQRITRDPVGHPQTFAVFASGVADRFVAGAIAPTKPKGLGCEFIPVLVDGRAVAEFSEEGRSGVLHLFRVTHCDGESVSSPWSHGWTHGGWIKSSELNAPAEAIADANADEVDAGETPLTGGLPGWA